MDLVGDRRGQSIQIGAILLFAVLIIAFASYQAFVVPSQNRGVEFNHNQEVQSDMQDLRNAVVSARGTGEGRSVSVQLGTRYPSRLVARNPSPPSGSLNTVGTTDDSVSLRIANAQAAGETGDFWNESQTYNTGSITYRPNYNVYANSPTTTYEQTVLYNQFPSGNITLSNQSFIDGTDISLVAINGSVSASSTQATSVDVQSVSSSTQRVRLENDDSAGPITITFTSRRSATYWDFLLETQSETVTSVTDDGATDGFYNVSVELNPDRTYSLQLTKVGVGTGVTDENAAYLTNVDEDGIPVSQGETTELTLDVRDRFNNPPDDASSLTVEAALAPGSDGTLGSNSKVPGEDGQVTFDYQATGSTGEQEIRFSYVGIDGDFDPETADDVSMTVEVTAPSGGGGGGGGNSAYSHIWSTPSNPEGGLGPCSASDCTWDVGASDSTLSLSAGTDPNLPGLDVTFLANNSTVGAPNPVSVTTGANGGVATELNAEANGTVAVYAISGGASAVLNVTVENVSSGDTDLPGGEPITGNPQQAFDDTDDDGQLDSGETTYSESDLYNFDDETVNLVIPSAVGQLRQDNSQISIRAKSITSEVDIRSQNSGITLTATEGVVRTGSLVRSDNQFVTISGKRVDISGTTVRADNGDVTLSATQRGGGVIIANDSAEIRSRNNDITLESVGDMYLDDSRVRTDNGAITADLGGANTLHIDGTTVQGTDAILYSPSGVTEDPERPIAEPA
jgi:hypothetical protein